LAAAVAPSGTISSMSQSDDIHIVWLDPDVNKSKENKKTQEKLKQLFSNSFKSFEKSEEAVNYIKDKQNQHILLITGGQIGRQIVPEINDLSQLKFIIIYCMNKEANKQWSRDYEKV
jgi:chlorite dismutase